MRDDMPKFRAEQIEGRISGIKARAESEILGAYFDGFKDGRHEERHNLIQRLKSVQSDSLVGKLLAELLEREEV